MSDITYTRITPAGEEKCSLLDGDGMTIEEMNSEVQNYCCSCDGCYDCRIRNLCDKCGGRFGRSDCENYTRAAYELIKGGIEFTKANPDDAVESEGDAVESDAVNHPNHYTQNGIECIDAIRASMTADGFMDYCKGNILKYIWRWRDKGGAEDLHKARVYLDWLIEEAEK